MGYRLIQDRSEGWCEDNKLLLLPGNPRKHLNEIATIEHGSQRCIKRGTRRSKKLLESNFCLKTPYTFTFSLEVLPVAFVGL